jgi:hypothetical protein
MEKRFWRKGIDIRIKKEIEDRPGGNAKAAQVREALGRRRYRGTRSLEVSGA